MCIIFYIRHVFCKYFIPDCCLFGGEREISCFSIISCVHFSEKGSKSNFHCLSNDELDVWMGQWQQTRRPLPCTMMGWVMVGDISSEILLWRTRMPQQTCSPASLTRTVLRVQKHVDPWWEQWDFITETDNFLALTFTWDGSESVNDSYLNYSVDLGNGWKQMQCFPIIIFWYFCYSTVQIDDYIFSNNFITSAYAS